MRARAFSLVELLVVIAVLAVLSALAIPALRAARVSAQVDAAKAQLEELKAAIAAYTTTFGDCPPSRLARLGLPGDGENEGIECLVQCLTTSAGRGPYLLLEVERLGNVDGDQRQATNPTRSTLPGPELRELLDPWGSPLAYIHNAEYDRGATVTLQGAPTPVAAAKDEAGQYRGLVSYQLWSAGPDGLAGTEDDLRAWGE